LRNKFDIALGTLIIKKLYQIHSDGGREMNFCPDGPLVVVIVSIIKKANSQHSQERLLEQG